MNRNRSGESEVEAVWKKSKETECDKSVVMMMISFDNANRASD